MSFLSKNWFLAITSLVICLILVPLSVQNSFGGWTYQTIELIVVFSLAFGVMKLISSIPTPVKT